jgi:DNA-binding CsgD family transcriptional regulator
MSQPTFGDTWPLVGRGPHLRAIEHLAKRGSAIVLCGQAGVGKTRLARESATRIGQPTEWVAATRAASAIPFGAVSHLLPDNPLNRPAMLRGVADRFATMPRPIIVVDDAHLLDDASAAVVHHLALRSAAFLLITVRSGEPCPDAVTALWKEGAASRLELSHLSAEAVGGLLDRAFGDRLEAVTRARLTRMSAGNPLLLRETLRAGLDTGSLRYRHGAWRWVGQLHATTRLAEVLAGRLGTIDEPVTRVLEVAACGEPIPVGLLERLADARSVGIAEHRGLITIERSGNRCLARLSHPLYGELIRSTTAQTRTRAIAGELATATIATPMRRRDDALRAGVWQLQSGRSGDPGMLLTAARQALRRFDVTLATRLAEGARDAGGGGRAESVLAQIMSNRGQSSRVLAEAGTPLTEAYRSLILLFDSRCAESQRVGESVLANREAEPQAVVWATIGACVSAGVLGDHERATTAFRHGLATAARHAVELPWARVQIGCAYTMALLAIGRVDDAMRLTAQEYASAVRAERPEPIGVWAGFHGVVAKTRGDLAGAAVNLRESLTLLSGYDTFRLAAPCLSALACTNALTGHARRAVRLLARADSPQRRTSRLFLPWIERDRAWTQAAAGNLTSAATTARRAASLARDLGQPTIEAWALYDAARLGDAPMVRVRLGQLTVGAAPVFATAAAALAAQDAEQLQWAALALQAMGLRLHAAEAATRAGVLFRSNGRQTRAAAVAELAKQCPDARTPLLDSTDLPATLTRREREVVQLASSGRSSKQIAAHLTLSVRTVDNYLGRAYLKLGVRSRAELAAILGTHQ